jgi:hypothetical protein
MASRLDMINRLATNAPIVNQQAADRLQAGRRMQVQQALGQPLLAGNTARQAQSVAPQSAQAAGQIQLQTQQQNVEQLTGLGRQAVQQAGTEQAARQQTQDIGQREQLAKTANAAGLELQRAEIQSNKRITKDEIRSAERVAKLGLVQDNRLIDVSLKQRRELANLGRDVKAQILDSRLQFEKVEGKRRFSNERQLADYTISHAKSEQDLANKMREMRQASEKSVMLLEHSGKQIMEAINRGWLTSEQKLDYAQKKKLLEMKAALDREIQRRKARSRNNQMVAQGVGTVVGAVIGSAAGPGGTVVGASVGGAVGTAAYGVGANSGAWE